MNIYKLLLLTTLLSFFHFTFSQIVITETHNDNTCHSGQGNNSYIKISVIGGTEPYTYEWFFSDSEQNFIPYPSYSYYWEEYSTINSDSILCNHSDSIDYKVIVNDSNGNIDSLIINISQTATNPQINIDADYYNFSWTTEDDQCIGEIHANASGGTPPYKYRFAPQPWYISPWWDSSILPNQCLKATITDSIWVSDSAGCYEYSNFFERGSDSWINSSNANNGLCNGQAQIAFETETLYYSWSHGNNNSSANYLCPGEYSVTITSPTKIGEYIHTFQIEAEFDELYEFVDTLNATVESCIIDNSLPIDSVFIYDYYYYTGSSDSVITVWHIWQGTSYYPINVGMNIENAGNNLVYLDVICNSKSNNSIETYSFFGMFNVSTSIRDTKPILVDIFPNPSNNKITIATPMLGSANIKLIDFQGKMVYSSLHDSKTTINVSEYPTGVYLIKIDTPQGPIVEKIIIE